MKISVSTIKELLSSDNGELKKVGLTMVIYFRMNDFSERITELTRDKDISVRTSALETLEKLQVRESIAQIASLVDDEDEHPTVRYSAIRALINMDAVKIIREEIKDLFHHDSQILRIGAIQAARKIRDEDYYEELLGIMCVGNLVLCEAAAKTIVDIKRDSRQELFELFILLLDEPDKAQNYGAIIGLGELRDKRSVDKLLKILKHYVESDDMEGKNLFIASIAETLGKIGSSKAFSELAGLLQHSDDGVRMKAATALGQIDHPDAGIHLKKAFEKEDNKFIKKHILDSLKSIVKSYYFDAVSSQVELEDIEIEAFTHIGELRDEKKDAALEAANADELVDKLEREAQEIRQAEEEEAETQKTQEEEKAEAEPEPEPEEKAAEQKPRAERTIPLYSGPGKEALEAAIKAAEKIEKEKEEKETAAAAADEAAPEPEKAEKEAEAPAEEAKPDREAKPVADDDAWPRPSEIPTMPPVQPVEPITVRQVQTPKQPVKAPEFEIETPPVETTRPWGIPRDRQEAMREAKKTPQKREITQRLLMEMEEISTEKISTEEDRAAEEISSELIKGLADIHVPSPAKSKKAQSAEEKEKLAEALRQIHEPPRPREEAGIMKDREHEALIQAIMDVHGPVSDPTGVEELLDGGKVALPKKKVMNLLAGASDFDFDDTEIEVLARQHEKLAGDIKAGFETEKTVATRISQELAEEEEKKVRKIDQFIENLMSLEVKKPIKKKELTGFEKEPTKPISRSKYKKTVHGYFPGTQKDGKD
ncbi:MAG: HEAT repeat domain-containing protein [Pseudomonadota bacterium]